MYTPTPTEIALGASFAGFGAGLWTGYGMTKNALAALRKEYMKGKAARLAPEEGGDYEAYPAQDKKHPLTVLLGKDELGREVRANLGKFPHMIVAGLSGGGKSNFINSIIVQLLKRPASQVQLCLLDMKEGIEFGWYEGVRHLAHDIGHTADGALSLLDWIEQERQRRQQAVKAARCKNLEAYNARNKKKIPFLVLVVDEIADLLAEDAESIDKLAKLGRLARSAGIHMILATQYPKADTVPTKLTVNCGGRMAFRLNNSTQSRVILDNAGAEELKGKGMGIFTHEGITRRIQTPFVPDEEIEAAVEAAQRLRRVA